MQYLERRRALHRSTGSRRRRSIAAPSATSQLRARSPASAPWQHRTLHRAVGDRCDAQHREQPCESAASEHGEPPTSTPLPLRRRQLVALATPTGASQRKHANEVASHHDGLGRVAASQHRRPWSSSRVALCGSTDERQKARWWFHWKLHCNAGDATSNYCRWGMCSDGRRQNLC